MSLQSYYRLLGALRTMYALLVELRNAEGDTLETLRFAVLAHRVRPPLHRMHADGILYCKADWLGRLGAQHSAHSPVSGSWISDVGLGQLSWLERWLPVIIETRKRAQGALAASVLGRTKC